jgi:hypothetical protein
MSVHGFFFLNFGQNQFFKFYGSDGRLHRHSLFLNQAKKQLLLRFQ